MKPLEQPYGSWPTPVTSELVVRAAARLGEVALDGDAVWWSEQRPEERGRTQLVRWRPGIGAADMLPDGFDARTSVHEYGGAAWWVRNGVVWFANWSDQRLYRFDTAADDEPLPITSKPEVPAGIRWADGDPIGTHDNRWLVAVRETHPPGGPAEVRNELVMLAAVGWAPTRVIVSGPDFVSNPRLSADGKAICWMQWNHPDMPWDGCELFVVPLALNGAEPDAVIGEPVRIAGSGTEGRPGIGESVFQPRWAADGSLWFVSDRTGWWNLYRWTPNSIASGGAYPRSDADTRPQKQEAGESSSVVGPDLGQVEPMVQIDAEIGVPQWVFGQSRYALLDDGRVVYAYQHDGFDHLAVRLPDGRLADIEVPYTSIAAVQAAGDQVTFVGASPTVEPAVVRIRLDGARIIDGPEILRPPRDLGLDHSWWSVPEPIAFPSSQGRTAHALFYPPQNPQVGAPPGEKPPLLVLIHGGPTGAARPLLQLGTQYWTSRGFAVVDVNYGGSSGYGRACRDQLRGAWGVVDVDDCEAAARWLADREWVDPQRLCIRGGSAGGYTTLSALAFRDTFAAGASHFGVADLEALTTETHKFEARYLDGLIGPYPEARELYVERSPIHHVEGFDRPLAVFQGMEDRIVPPNQAELIVDALRQRGVPVAYMRFENEQHGFRQAANIRRALDGELSFYAQVFGFDLPPDEAIEPIVIENLHP